MEFHHVGIATHDADALAARFSVLFDTPVVHEERLDELSVTFLGFGGIYAELLEPLEDGGTVARYLDRNGRGIHHLAISTHDIAHTLDRAREHGVECIDEEPRPGAWGHEVAFLHPKSTGGVLVELVTESSNIDEESSNTDEESSNIDEESSNIDEESSNIDE